MTTNQGVKTKRGGVKRVDPTTPEEELRQKVRAATRLIKVKNARDKLEDFICLTMPDASDPDDANLSRYKPVKHHRALMVALEEVEKGTIPRLIVCMPPRAGKSEIISRKFPAWFVGKDPYRSLILTSFNQDSAQGFGSKVRDVMQSDVYGHVFPGAVLKKGSQAQDFMETTEGGTLTFAGRGGTLTGRGGHVIIVDDPIKGRQEAGSKLIRDQMWNWFNDDVMTRLMDDSSSVVIVLTRWHEDDLVGRLMDDKNEHYRVEEAMKWRILNLTALAEDNDPLGRKKGESLWPEKFSKKYYEDIRSRNPKGFQSLYQGKPTTEDGDFFKAAWIKTYQPYELPKNLRFYGASDHAPGAKEEGDRNVAGCVGVDEHDVIWILPDLYWQRAQTDILVDVMIDHMEKRRPIFWWAEDEHIGKSIGPFLRKRMLERKVYCAVVPSSAAKDKRSRALAFQGRCAMGMVRFPAFAPWFEDAKDELLKFPDARHDDFVSWCSHIGRGVDQMLGMKPTLLYAPPNEPKSGTMSWIKWSEKWAKLKQEKSNTDGW